ncbi:MAG: OmpH family outer membrane protein [Lentisphaerales bacterium]|jgi:Skp family chaperone for outer membrane proteins|nr:MAG: OmpH family outer membrane protein [Lentisphaerales bacterium]
MITNRLQWLIAPVVLLCLFVGSARAADQVLAVVDTGRVLREFYKTEAADDEIDRQKKEGMAKLRDMQDELKKQEKEFEVLREAAQNRALKDDVRQQKLEESEDKLIELKESEQKVVTFFEEQQQALREQSMRMRKRLLDEIEEAITIYARGQGLMLVVDSGVGVAEMRKMVVFSDKSIDISAAIIEILNRKAKKEGER